MRFSMIATYFAVILATLALMSVYIIALLSESLYDSELVDMYAKANIISDTVSQNWEQDEGVYDQIINQSLAGTNIRGVITNTAYTVMYDSNKESDLIGKVFMRDIIRNTLGGHQAQQISENESGIKMMTVAVPVTKNSDVVGSVYLTVTVDHIDKTITSIQWSLIVFSILISILVGMLSLGMSYIVTSPLVEFIDVAREISKGDFSKRIKVRGKTELAELAKALNSMCDQLALLEEKRRKFVSDASHELKTPMATIKLICDSIVSTPNPDVEMVREFLNDLSEEIDRLTRIIERLLVLTKLDNTNADLKYETVDFIALIKRIMVKLTPMADSRGTVFSVNLGQEILPPMMLDYDKIWEALYNIIDNAIKYSPDRSLIKIQVYKEGGFVITQIEDNGPGIPDTEKERIFERFYRLDDSRARDTGGTGLGLSIAKEAVTMHGGNIEVTSGKDGGSKFIITLPIGDKPVS